MKTPTLGDFLRLSDDPLLAQWGVEMVDKCSLDTVGDIASRVYDLAVAALGDQPRIHPSAYVSPLANVGPDAIIGPNVAVHEFATVRGKSVLSTGVHIGYGCEVNRTVLCARAALAHRVTIGFSAVGAFCHVSSALNVASCHLWNPDLLHPTQPVSITLADGRVLDTGVPKFGAILGHRARIAINTIIGPGTVIGTDSVLYSGVEAPGVEIPPNSVVRPTRPVRFVIEPRRPETPSFTGVLP